MAFYSVWDWNRNAWSIYATDRPASVGDDPIPPRPSVLSPIGADPDSDVKSLPAGARHVGFSHLARGEVRRLPGSSNDVGDDAGANGGGGGPSWRPLALFAAGALAATLFFRMRGKP